MDAGRHRQMQWDEVEEGGMEQKAVYNWGETNKLEQCMIGVLPYLRMICPADENSELGTEELMLEAYTFRSIHDKVGITTL